MPDSKNNVQHMDEAAFQKKCRDSAKLIAESITFICKDEAHPFPFELENAIQRLEVIESKIRELSHKTLIPETFNEYNRLFKAAEKIFIGELQRKEPGAFDGIELEQPAQITSTQGFFRSSDKEKSEGKDEDFDPDFQLKK
ncbi:MAG: hypothetical protein SFW66_03140 [Gammaproteobacteria bacterium]|nr:hypothetical protein [Gammaproteobacteria bacterium]